MMMMSFEDTFVEQLQSLKSQQVQIEYGANIIRTGILLLVKKDYIILTDRSQTGELVNICIHFDRIHSIIVEALGLDDDFTLSSILDR